MILHDIRSLFLLQTTITTALPPKTIQRTLVPAIFCDNAMQGFAPPFCILTDTGQDPKLTLAEPVFGMRELELDIDVCSFSDVQARTAMDAIRRFFDDYSGVAGFSTILAVLWQDESYRYDQINLGSDTRYHISTTSYLVQFETS